MGFLEGMPDARQRELQGGTNAVRLISGANARIGWDHVHSLICRVACNAMALAPEAEVRQATSTHRVMRWNDVGIGLYPSGAMLNHSCSPSCLWYVRGGVLIVETLRVVSKGEALTIPYLPVSRSCDASAAARRRRLAKLFGFHCICSRCSAEDLKKRPSSFTATVKRKPSAVVKQHGKSSVNRRPADVRRGVSRR